MKKGMTEMWYVIAKLDPLGGVNTQKYVGLTLKQARAVRKEYSDKGWGVVLFGRMEETQ